MTINHANDQVESEEDEIDLKDYLHVLYRWKLMIVSGTLCIFLIAGVVTFLMAPVYRIQSMVEVGVMMTEADRTEVIVNPKVVVANIEEGVYDNSICKKLDIPDNSLPEIKATHPRNTALVKINIESKELEQNLKALDVLSGLILQNHSELIRSERERVTSKLQVVENKMDLLNSEKESLEKQVQLISRSAEQMKKSMNLLDSKISELEREKGDLKQTSNRGDSLGRLLVVGEIQDLRQYYYQFSHRVNIDLPKEELRIQSELSDNRAESNFFIQEKERLSARLSAFRDTRMVKPPGASVKSLWVKKLSQVILSGLAATLVLTFVAFFIEFWKKQSISGR